MFYGHVVIAIIVIVLCVGSSISYNQTVKRKKNRKAMQSLYRSLSSEEAAAVRAYYDIDIQAGADVYRIEGPHDTLALKSDDLVVGTHLCIAGVEVFFCKVWEAYLQEVNRAEIVFDTSKQIEAGYLLNLNGLMDISRLVLKEKIQKGAPGKIVDASITIIGNRLMTRAEAKYFSNDVRFWAWLLITVGLWCAFWNPYNATGSVVSLGLVVVGIIRYFFKKKPPLIKVTCFSGRLVEKVKAIIRDDELSVSKNLYIGEVAVHFPDHWKPYLTVDREYQVEGVLKVKAQSTLTTYLVAVGDVLGINSECECFGHAGVGRYIMGVFFMALSLFFLWYYAYQPVIKIKKVWQALIHYGEPVYILYALQGAVLIICIALLSYLIVRIALFIRWSGNRSRMIEQFYESHVKKGPSRNSRKESDLDRALLNNSGLLDLSSATILSGVMGSDDLKIDHVLFDGRNVWQDVDIPDRQPIPEVVTVRWGRHSKAVTYEATLYLNKELVTDYFKPYGNGEVPLILTFLIKKDREVMAVRTMNFNLEGDLPLFAAAKGQKCFEL